LAADPRARAVAAMKAAGVRLSCVSLLLRSLLGNDFAMNVHVRVVHLLKFRSDQGLQPREPEKPRTPATKLKLPTNTPHALEPKYDDVYEQRGDPARKVVCFLYPLL
jgi:hypothetical protein